jgi:two-component system response regulator DegU
MGSLPEYNAAESLEAGSAGRVDRGPGMNRVKVMIVDKQVFSREGLRQALSQEAGLELLDCEPDQDLAAVIEAEAPDVVLLDIDYPSLRGLRLGKKIAHRFRNTSVVFLTPNPSVEELFEALKSGAMAYLNKNTTVEDLVATIREVFHGEYPIDDLVATIPEAADRLAKEFRGKALMIKPAHAVIAPITYREKQILDFIAQGKTNKQIGGILQISEQTVKSHISSVLRKLNASHRAHAVALAIREGWIGVEGNHSERPWPEARVRKVSA